MGKVEGSEASDADFGAGRKSTETASPLSRTVSFARRSHTDIERSSGIARCDLTPTVQSAVDQLMNELEQVKSELSKAQRRVAELECEADEDPLVPLLNRRGFVRELDRAIAFAARHKLAISLIYIDLNDFKTVNDHYGHAAGDDALRHVAGLLTDNVRRSDIVGRLGGDEFAIVLQKADLEAAQTKAAHIEQAVGASVIVLGAEEVRLAISAGAAAIVEGDTAEKALRRADEAMFIRKSTLR